MNYDDNIDDDGSDLDDFYPDQTDVIDSSAIRMPFDFSAAAARAREDFSRFSDSAQAPAPVPVPQPKQRQAPAPAPVPAPAGPARGGLPARPMHPGATPGVRPPPAAHFPGGSPPMGHHQHPGAIPSARPLRMGPVPGAPTGVGTPVRPPVAGAIPMAGDSPPGQPSFSAVAATSAPQQPTRVTVASLTSPVAGGAMSAPGPAPTAKPSAHSGIIGVDPESAPLPAHLRSITSQMASDTPTGSSSELTALESLAASSKRVPRWQQQIQRRMLTNDDLLPSRHRYSGPLMCVSDKAFLTRMHVSLLQTMTPYVDDYYCLMYSQRDEPQKKPASGADTPAAVADAVQNPPAADAAGTGEAAAAASAVPASGTSAAASATSVATAAAMGSAAVPTSPKPSGARPPMATADGDAPSTGEEEQEDAELRRLRRAAEASTRQRELYRNFNLSRATPTGRSEGLFSSSLGTTMKFRRPPQMYPGLTTLLRSDSASQEAASSTAGIPEAPDAGSSRSQHLRILRAIEAVYSRILRYEDWMAHETSGVQLTSDTNFKSSPLDMEKLRQAVFNEIILNEEVESDPESILSHALSFLSYDKGVRAMRRVIPLLEREQLLGLLPVIVHAFASFAYLHDTSDKAVRPNHQFSEYVVTPLSLLLLDLQTDELIVFLHSFLVLVNERILYSALSGLSGITLINHLLLRIAILHRSGQFHYNDDNGRILAALATRLLATIRGQMSAFYAHHSSLNGEPGRRAVWHLLVCLAHSVPDDESTRALLSDDGDPMKGPSPAIAVSDEMLKQAIAEMCTVLSAGQVPSDEIKLFFLVCGVPNPEDLAIATMSAEHAAAAARAAAQPAQV
ncbi:hypothetical protein H696_05270 [Fonticula alba]|uniref:mRNA decay factor PAT1 domain-containing protein n=1 Tax=Fonticula alba TaxID=691883 RepID=A0A058Z244_FONAL|nr:hypothetical protein H696_05270 [Fonticula alba]KCV68354.1 hypothetical protein H696_05270 [Fonticula alba]|eukprot:XP_009497408.1 hypothetical protein H696_05270 [Fonticula alba]